jgi:hypothetical protein
MKLLNRERWERARARGVRRFVLVQGVLLFGCSFAVYTAVIAWAFTQFHLFGVKISLPELLPRLVSLLLIEIFVGGSLWAVGTWYLSEWLYRRLSRAS